MKLLSFVLAFFALPVYCSSQETVSSKTFPEIALLNKIEFQDSSLNQAKFGCGFLLSYNNDTFAVTAKHLLKFVKPGTMKTLSFDAVINDWSLFSLEKPSELALTSALLNADKTQKLESKSAYIEDWLIFSLKANHSNASVLAARKSPLAPGEKLYVIGWTRRMESGRQRVYEFEYYKTVGNRLLLKEVVVPPQLGGLSGAPVVDEQGAVVGIVSNSTEDPDTDQKYFSPCTIDGVISFLEKYRTH